MRIDVSPAPDGFAVVRNLFALYMHDMSEFVALDVEDDGAFAIPASLGAYWDRNEASERFPFLIRADGKLAGFALIHQLAASPAAHDVGEFFILRKYRRAGIGGAVARDLFDRFPGAWQVRELPANTSAQAFWRRTIDDYTRGAFSEGREFFAAYGRDFVVQRFRSASQR